MADTPHTPDMGFKVGWTNPMMASSTSYNQDPPSACSTPRLTNSNAGRHQAQFKHGGESKNSLCADEVTMNNVVTMVRFATALMENLARINKHAWQDFRLRIGIAIGPVIAGVVGATKPTYDIWGDTVNVASRLESSGVLGRIQVSEQVAQILTKASEFEVECRGPIEVKGKGQLTTYLVRTLYDISADNNFLADQIYGCEDLQLAIVDGESIGPPDVVTDNEVEELCAA